MLIVVVTHSRGFQHEKQLQYESQDKPEQAKNQTDKLTLTAADFCSQRLRKGSPLPRSLRATCHKAKLQ